MFGNHEFIFVTYGRNTMFEGTKEVNIEDWIQENLQNDDTPMQFFSKFKEVFEGVAIPPTKYTFGVGSHDARGYYLEEWVFDTETRQLTQSEKHYNNQVYMGGEEMYREIWDKYIQFQEYESLDTIAKKAKIQLECLVRIFDTKREYNSVGLPIQTKIFQCKNAQ